MKFKNLVLFPAIAVTIATHADDWAAGGIQKRDFRHDHSGPEEMPHRKKRGKAKDEARDEARNSDKEDDDKGDDKDDDKDDDSEA